MLRAWRVTQVWRQSDMALVSCLNRIRRGTFAPADIRWLNTHCAAGRSGVGATAVSAAAGSAVATPRPMLLAPTNAVVNDRNSRELQAMRVGRTVVHLLSSDWVEVDEECGRDAETVRRALLRAEPGCFFGDCLAERRVELCEAARVILLYNLDLEAEGPLKLCNGSLGVVGPMPSAEEVAAAVDQKVSELESAEAQASEQAQAARAPQDQGLERIHYYKIYRSRLRQWVTADRSRGDDVGRNGGCWNRPFLVPRVRFDNGRDEILLPVLLQSEVVGQGVCYRLQVPLKAAWAVTIHKSQGMTLDAATVQVAGCFDAGMVRAATHLHTRSPPQQSMSGPALN